MTGIHQNGSTDPRSDLAEHDPATGGPWRAAVNQIATRTAEQFRTRWNDSPDQPPSRRRGQATAASAMTTIATATPAAVSSSTESARKDERADLWQCAPRLCEWQ
jgi:hypothetical protein